MRHGVHLAGRGGCVAIALGVGAALATTAPVAAATPNVGSAAGSGGVTETRDLVPLNGESVLNQALDRQTFNGSPLPGVPVAEIVRFATACDESGCVAHSNLVARDVPFDFHWTGTQWKSVQKFEWTCADQQAPATVTYTLTPNVNGTLSGDRTAVIAAPGCGNPRAPGTAVAPVTGVPG